ncbi:uncharacterized protein DUF4301 [Nonlabens dokdonensis]|uniref:DUF4301 domain-containing protein n=2 Tax=Nonlabens dokdonensis TaxID=328515 RepID=L7WCK0_NONDD|nr:DUF4301 family protein [Nonlabens dokdonensis]AGC76648.1 hypothetical protein DDD_1521 [Nonlabens dokdonensis DSW-6]PZX44297.1 uncharacterized protein DUF4301 [Nonlabens dokdonensis]
MNLTNKQKEQLEKKGISEELLISQLERFKKGFPVVKLDRPAKVNDGIVPLKDLSLEKLINHYEEHVSNLSLIKFVPASGAATRMFKFLHELLNNFDPQEDSLNSYINSNKAQELFTFFVAMEKFPFYNAVIKSLKSKHKDWLSKPFQAKKLLFIEEMLLEDGFNFAAMPKGLVPFHKYKDHTATAFEEHLFEACIYAKSEGVARLHFTIAPAFKDHFSDEFARIQEIVERKTNATFDISFSYQSSSTDTIAVNQDNEAIVLEDGCLFFRPAGHGALLENLNQLDADLIFIKNIDNVTTSAHEQEIGRYKKILAGYLLKVQEQVFEYLQLLKSGTVDTAIKSDIEEFLTQQLDAVLPSGYQKYAPEYQLEYLFNQLNRPLRVCGMVKNEGEPGGGPFWVVNNKGEHSLQIVESAQIDTNNKKQKEIAKKATHFNPVDLICSVRDYQGNKFDLMKYCDPETGFITYKTRNGRKIKAQELPGLWNGGMACWNTVFVEVPLETFNPVKTVNDLLKSAHQLN